MDHELLPAHGHFISLAKLPIVGDWGRLGGMELVKALRLALFRRLLSRLQPNNLLWLYTCPLRLDAGGTLGIGLVVTAVLLRLLLSAVALCCLLVLSMRLFYLLLGLMR